MTIREQIIDLVKNNKRIIVNTDMYCYLDWLAIDTDDPDTLTLLTKFNTSALIKVDPTFGTLQTGTGLQEVIIPYNQIYMVEALDASSIILKKFKERFPQEYERWQNASHVEGVTVIGEVPGVNTLINNS